MQKSQPSEILATISRIDGDEVMFVPKARWRGCAAILNGARYVLLSYGLCDFHFYDEHMKQK